MLFDDTYYTVKSPAEGLFKDRGSKFFGYIFPVKNEQQVKEHLAQLRKEHHGARHHCYAYRLGPDKQNFRANDDGEPSNTAGKPILGQIQAHDLTDVLIVVVRYFGGTLLGVSGLIHAYKQGAIEAIQSAEIQELHIQYHYKASFRFEQTSEIMKILKLYEGKITEQGFDGNSFLEFDIRKSFAETFEDKARQHPSPFLSLVFQGLH